MTRLWTWAVQWRGRWWILACIAVYATLGAVIALIGRDRPRLEVGQVVVSPVVARVGFEAVDRDQTRIRREQAREMEPAVYVPNTHHLNEIREKLLTAARQVLADTDPEPSTKNAETRPGRSFTAIHTVDPGLTASDHSPVQPQAKDGTRSIHRSAGRDGGISGGKSGGGGGDKAGADVEASLFTGQALEELRAFVASHQLRDWDALIDQFMQELQGLAVLDDDRVDLERQPQQLASKIVILHPSLGEQFRSDESLLAASDREMVRKRVADLLEKRLSNALRTAIADVVVQHDEPIYRFDAQQTLSRRVLKFNDDSLNVTRNKTANEVLIGAGQRLTGLDLELLNDERAAFRAQFGLIARRLAAPAMFGIFLLIGIGLWAYIAKYNPCLLDKPWQGIALMSLMLACHWLSIAGGAWQPRLGLAGAAFSIALVTVLVLVLYGQRFALAVGGIQTLAQAISLDGSTGITLVMIVGVAVSVGLLKQVRTRSTLIRVGLWTGLAMGLTTVMVGLVDLSARLWPGVDLPAQFLHIGLDGVNVLLAGLAVGLLVQGGLPGIERLFGVTTAMTLRELTDSSHPLLRRLAQETPGTYQHSLRMADLAEAAAEAVGADPLLCRVGAMYHDVGKINKPLYFVENQAGGPNRHNKLSPTMSVLIIVGHVKDGIELAREYGLPQPICHFVESHHGTTVVEYFFHAAKRLSGLENKPSPQEFEFRYPGPKPRTKEAAILMLADGVEGAARAMGEPNPSRIEQLVHGMLNKRLMDGQFDECNVTLQELHKIECSIAKTLCAIYHARIRYPSAEPSQPAEAELPEAQPDPEVATAS